MSSFPTIRWSGVLLLAASFALAGCKADQAVRKSSTLDRSVVPAQTTEAPSQPTPPDPRTTGTISGVVSFKGVPPARVPIDMSMDPACAFGENKSEQVVVAGGKLANVYVYLKGVTPSQAPAGEKPVVLDQQGCRYTPHVIAVQQGGSVEFRNSDRTVHNVHMVTTVGGNPTVDITENPGGQPEVRQFKTPAQMIPVRCNNHPSDERVYQCARTRHTLP